MAPQQTNATIPTQHTQVIQNQTTGAVDFLKYNGNTLVASSEHDYGLGSDFKIVASGNFTGNGDELVAQSQSTGKLDFLKLDANGNLLSSAMTSVSVPTVHGGGYFGANVLVSQLSNGEIDFLKFDQTHTLVGSQLDASTVGLPKLVGVGTGLNEGYAQFSPLSPDVNNLNSSLLTQLPDGTLDAVGFSGTFGSLKFSSSLLLSQTKGTGQAVATNQENYANQDDGGESNPVVQVSTQSSSSFDSLYLQSGYFSNDANAGAYIATTRLPSYSGWNFVDGGAVAADLNGFAPPFNGFA